MNRELIDSAERLRLLIKNASDTLRPSVASTVLVSIATNRARLGTASFDTETTKAIDDLERFALAHGGTR